MIENICIVICAICAILFVGLIGLLSAEIIGMKGK